MSKEFGYVYYYRDNEFNATYTENGHFELQFMDPLVNGAYKLYKASGWVYKLYKRYKEANSWLGKLLRGLETTHKIAVAVDKIASIPIIGKVYNKIVEGVRKAKERMRAEKDRRVFSENKEKVVMLYKRLLGAFCLHEENTAEQPDEVCKEAQQQILNTLKGMALCIKDKSVITAIHDSFISGVISNINRGPNTGFAERITEKVSQFYMGYEGENVDMREYPEVDCLRLAYEANNDVMNELLPISWRSNNALYVSYGSLRAYNWLVEECIKEGSCKPEDFHLDDEEWKLHTAWKNIISKFSKGRRKGPEYPMRLREMLKMCVAKDEGITSTMSLEEIREAVKVAKTLPKGKRLRAIPVGFLLRRCDDRVDQIMSDMLEALVEQFGFEKIFGTKYHDIMTAINKSLEEEGQEWPEDLAAVQMTEIKVERAFRSLLEPNKETYNLLAELVNTLRLIAVYNNVRKQAIKEGLANSKPA